MSSERQAFRDLELRLGNATFRGEVDSRQPAGCKACDLLKLAGGALDVDGLSAFASLFVSDVGVNRFAESDLDLKVKAGPVSVAGLTADTVDTALRLREAQLEIDRLSIGGLAGASISATGAVKDFPENPTGNIDASLVAVDLAPLIAAAAERYRGNVLVQGLQAALRPIAACSRMRGSTSWRRLQRMSTAPPASRSAPTALQAAQRCRRRCPATATQGKLPTPRSRGRTRIGAPRRR